MLFDVASRSRSENVNALAAPFLPLGKHAHTSARDLGLSTSVTFYTVGLLLAQAE